ncbi:MAG: PIN domain-containing protein [Deltaproteobacteria bacterium]|nr:PIN domain-containing protein [Deltaproteobacteria bacterium]
MGGFLVDSSVILDVFQNDPFWAERSEALLAACSIRQQLFINPVVYAEVSIGFVRIEELEEALAGCDLRILPIPKEALFLAGKAFLKYRRRKGSKASPLPDFFIGAHAAVENLQLLTRDVTRIKTYFPTVKIISP